MEHQSITKGTDSKVAVVTQRRPQPGSSLHLAAHSLDQLRQAFGNRALGQFIQAKLKVSRPDDPYEREADHVADEVMRMPAFAPLNTATTTCPTQLPQVQRKCEACKEELPPSTVLNSHSGPHLARKCAGCDQEKQEEFQLKEIPGASPAAHPLIRHVTGGGRPLDASVRSFFEPRFGYAFEGVRIHTGGHAAESARALNAHAYTLGKDIVFNEGRYSPETDTGRRLLAHELVHVVQQGRGGSATNGRLAARVQRTADSAIARQAEPPSPGEGEQKSAGPAPQIPSEIVAEIESMLENSDSEADDSSLSRIGQMAVRLLGPTGVVAVAQQAGVPGADRREQEAESESGPTVQRQAREAAAATAGTMWWLTLVDGPLPIGDIVYGALIIGAAIAASRAVRRCRCTIRYAPPEIMAQCPERVYGTGVTIGDCQNVAKFTAPQQCRRYYGHCGFMP